MKLKYLKINKEAYIADAEILAKRNDILDIVYLISLFLSILGVICASTYLIVYGKPRFDIIIATFVFVITHINISEKDVFRKRLLKTTRIIQGLCIHCGYPCKINNTQVNICSECGKKPI